MDIKFYLIIDDNWNAIGRRIDERNLGRISEFAQTFCNCRSTEETIFYTVSEDYIVRKS